MEVLSKMLVKRCFFSSLVIAVLAFSVLSVIGADPDRPSTQTNTAANGGLVTVTAPTVQTSTGMNIFVNIGATDTTGLGVTGFDGRIQFDPAVVTFQGCSLTGTIFSSANVFCNLFPTPNVIAVNVNGINPVAGAGSILRLNFQVIGTEGQSSPLNFVSFMFNEGDPASVTNNGSINLLDTTAAGVSLSGRLLDPHSRPIGGAIISVSDGAGGTMTTRTNSFGNFRFANLQAGDTYVLSSSARGYTINPVAIFLTDSISDIRLIAER